MKKFALLATLLSVATPSFAGDAAVGEDLFNKRCKSCHAVVDASGNAIVKGGKTGPNLFGVIGRQVGAAEGFTYGKDLVEAGADGTVWDEASLADYVVDPSKWISTKLGAEGKKSKMSFKLKEGGADVAAFLAAHK